MSHDRAIKILILVALGSINYQLSIICASRIERQIRMSFGWRYLSRLDFTIDIFLRISIRALSVCILVV